MKSQKQSNIQYPYLYIYLGISVVKNPPAKAGDTGSIYGWGIPWRRTWQCSSILAEIISFAEEPGRLQFVGLQRVRHDLATQQQLQNLSLSLISLSIYIPPGWFVYLLYSIYISIIVWDFHSIFPRYLTSFNSQRH